MRISGERRIFGYDSPQLSTDELASSRNKFIDRADHCTFQIARDHTKGSKVSIQLEIYGLIILCKIDPTKPLTALRKEHHLLKAIHCIK